MSPRQKRTTLGCWLAGALFLSATTTVFAQAAEPDASPDTQLDQQPIVLLDIWPPDGATLSFTPEIWARFDSVLLDSVALVEVETGIEHPMLLLDASNPEFGRPNPGRLIAFRGANLPPSTALILVATNQNDVAEIATYTTSTSDVAEPVVPVINPVFEVDVDRESVTMWVAFEIEGDSEIEGATEEDNDFAPNVLAALISLEDESTSFDAAGTSVLHREIFRPTTTALPLNTITGPGDAFKVCLAVGVVGVNQMRILPDVDNATCITKQISEQEWDELATERERLREDEEGQQPQPLLFLCADTKPLSNSGPTSAALLIFALAFAVRRKRRD